LGVSMTVKITQLLNARPGSNLSLRFILLEKRGYHNWIADETASAVFVLRGSGAPAEADLEEGEIYLLQHGEAVLDQHGRIQFQTGRNGRLLRDGFLTLSFKESPDLTREPWEPRGKAPEEEKVGHKCFLCGEEDHSVFNCKFLEQGVVIKSPHMETVERTERRYLLQTALEAQGLQCEACRWYKKENTPGMLYARLGSKEEADELLAAKELLIGGETAQVFAISQKAAQKRQPKQWPKKRPKAKAKAEPSPTSVTNDERPAKTCFLCGEVGHEVAACPYWRQGVQIVGATASEENDLAECLRNLKVEPVSLRCSEAGKPHFAVRLGSARQVRDLAKKSINGQLRLLGRVLRAYPFRGDESISGAEPVAPAAPPTHAAKRDRAGEEGDAGGRRPKAARRTHEMRKACFLCGDPSHELPDCPFQRECILVCRQWGSNSHADPQVQQDLLSALADKNYQAVRHYWHGGVCYVRLRSEEEANGALRTWGGKNRLPLGEEEFQVRVARSTRRPGGPERPESKKPVVEETGEEEICALCGSLEHALLACPHRQCGLRISCASLSKDAAAALEQVKAATSAAELEGIWASEARWHRNALFVIMVSDGDAKALLHFAAAEGLEIDGDMASVEPAAAKKKQGSWMTRTPGLRPEVHKSKKR